MARKPQIQIPGEIYHVMNRGDRRKAIFSHDEDRLQPPAHYMIISLTDPFSANQRTSVVNADGKYWVCSYDSLGQVTSAIKHWSDGSASDQTNEIHYIYDGNLVVQERDINNLATKSFTPGTDLSGSMHGAGGIGALLAMSLSPVVNPQYYYYHADGNGNVTALINGLQFIAAKYMYDPFGNLLSQSGLLAGINKYQFSSKEKHQPSGLIAYTYRYYDPNLQRWVNRDPLQEKAGDNLFYYIGNGPVYGVDPLGLKYAEIWAGAGAVGGAGAAAAGSIVVDAYTGGINITATPAEIAAGGVIGGAVGYAAGWWIDLFTGNRTLPTTTCPARITSSGLPPGYWPGPAGAAEWGRRNGVDPQEAVGNFHDIKGEDPMSGATYKYGVNPATGDVIDPEGNSIGDLNE